MKAGAMFKMRGWHIFETIAQIQMFYIETVAFSYINLKIVI